MSQAKLTRAPLFAGSGLQLTGAYLSSRQQQLRALSLLASMDPQMRDKVLQQAITTLFRIWHGPAQRMRFHFKVLLLYNLSLKGPGSKRICSHTLCSTARCSSQQSKPVICRYLSVNSVCMLITHASQPGLSLHAYLAALLADPPNACAWLSTQAD